jgi:hypothetical protein
MVRKVFFFSSSRQQQQQQQEGSTTTLKQKQAEEGTKRKTQKEESTTTTSTGRSANFAPIIDRLSLFPFFFLPPSLSSRSGQDGPAGPTPFSFILRFSSWPNPSKSIAISSPFVELCLEKTEIEETDCSESTLSQQHRCVQPYYTQQSALQTHDSPRSLALSLHNKSQPETRQTGTRGHKPTRLTPRRPLFSPPSSPRASQHSFIEETPFSRF